jgi:hypothetical protein
MIDFRVISDHQRLALLRDGRGCRLVGPGVILAMKWPGRRHFLISRGDCGPLVTKDQAQFGDARLPVERQGCSTSGTVQIIDFRKNVIVVAPGPEEAGPSRAATHRVAVRKAAPVRYSPLAFWIGLPLVLCFAVVCWLGVWYAADQIHTERVVYARGVSIAGTVVEKIQYFQTMLDEQTHYITYVFQIPSGATVCREKIRVEPAVWNSLRPSGPISIRYVPDAPELNLPDGWHMTRFYCLAGGIALTGALLFSVVTVGMLVKKLSGGYRGETHPFLGGPSPRQGS